MNDGSDGAGDPRDSGVIDPRARRLKGETRIVNGDRWTVVDVAPAAPLAEMVAAILEEEGFVAMTGGMDVLDDALSHLGATAVGTTFVLVPEEDAPRALALIDETVTDFEGPELDELMRRIAAGEVSSEELEELGIEVARLEGADGEPDDDSAGGSDPDAPAGDAGGTGRA